jgi:hypothetical protein
MTTKCNMCGFVFGSNRDELEIMLDIGHNREAISHDSYGDICYLCDDELRDRRG